jgi:hypothetical protein
VDYVHDRALAKLEAQSADWDVIDGRLRFILGAVGVIFAVVLGLQRGQGASPPAVAIASLLALAFYFIAAIMAVWRYWPAQFHRPPGISGLRETVEVADAHGITLEALKEKAIEQIEVAFEKNRDIMDAKLRAFKLAFQLTFLATFAMFIAVMTQIYLQAWDPTLR